MIFVISDLSPSHFFYFFAAAPRSGGNFRGTVHRYDRDIGRFAHRRPARDDASMSIEQIYQAMDQNRTSYDQRIAQIRRRVESAPQLRRRLADVWIEAMQQHYHLLWEYLLLRDVAIRCDQGSSRQLNAEQLRAPRRPAELPESLSRYVTTTQHAEQLI
jgi:hypothetical protein